jgi:excinuclease UvrABC nuclease subunit
VVLSQVLEFAPERDAEVFAAVKEAPAVFAMRGEPGAEPYVSKTANLRRRLQRLLAPPAPNSKRLNLRGHVRTIEYAVTGSDFESGLLLYRVLRREFPRNYAARLRWRPAPLLRLVLENEYPRVTVTTRIATLRGRSLYYGPFPARAVAEKFANDALDFFNLRRCTDDLHPDPAFPGCIYSQMKMCLAPCFRGCTDGEYRAEVERVQAFFDTRGQALLRELTAQREAASAALEFENAAGLHLRLEKLNPLAAQIPEIVRRIDRLAGVIVQPSAELDTVVLFRIEAGQLNGPIPFPLQHKSAERSSKPQSMESRISETLAAVPSLPLGTAVETMEQLAYLKRWYYRSAQVGEVFFTDEKDELPLRRLVRGISRVSRGERPGGELHETTADYWINRGKAAVLNPENYNV